MAANRYVGTPAGGRRRRALAMRTRGRSGAMLTGMNHQRTATAEPRIGRATGDRAPERFETGRFGEALLALLPTIYSTAVVMTGDTAQAEEFVLLTFERGRQDLAHVEALSDVRIRMLRFLTQSLRSLGGEWPDFRLILDRPEVLARFEGTSGRSDDEARSPITSLETMSCAELSEALRSLPPFARLPLWRSGGEGLPHREIAEVLGTSIGSVRQALHLARRALRGVLSERAGDERWDG